MLQTCPEIFLLMYFVVSRAEKVARWHARVNLPSTVHPVMTSVIQMKSGTIVSSTGQGHGVTGQVRDVNVTVTNRSDHFEDFLARRVQPQNYGSWLNTPNNFPMFARPQIRRCQT